MARKADPTIRGRLLDAARAEFSAHGLDGARISVITARAGVSKGAFYLHFETKEHAFEEVANEFFRTVFAMLDGLETMLEERTDIAEIHRELHERDLAVMEYLWSERAFARVLFEGAHSAKHCHLIEAFAGRVENRVHDLLRIDQRHGRLREGLNLEILAGFVAGGFDRYARFLLSATEKPDIARDLKGLQEFMCFGMLSPEMAERLLAISEPPESETRTHSNDGPYSSDAAEARLPEAGFASPVLRPTAREP